MKKVLWTLLLLLIVILLISSFPIRDIWGCQNISDIFRLIGFILLFLVCCVKLFGRNK